MAASKARISQNTFAIAFIAIGLPAFLGLGLTSALVAIPLATLSIFLVADLVADSFSTLHRGNFLLSVARSVMIGWASGVAILFAALLAMNAMFWTGSLLLPPSKILVDAMVLSLTACLLAAGTSLTVRRNAASATNAKLTLKLILAAATLGSLYGCKKAQSEGWFLPTTSRITSLSFMAAAFFLLNAVALMVVAFNALPEDVSDRRP
jgi:heme/copper-type cytochrome/quinol oxidase subunit 3